ncbi:MAG: Trigger factor [Parcubacteria group bacterium Licking1014_1]|nr:MAG: Trigger factor [Parcubacteria group bacterium Licking1014_1]
MKTTQTKLPKSQIEIEFELAPEEFKKHVDNALLHLKEHVKVDGFRPGQAPAKIIEERIGKENLLMEAGDIAVKEVYLKYISGNKLEPIGQPEVQIMKIAQGSPFIFKIKITILPDVELPGYKEIANKIKDKEVFVTEQEVQGSLNYLQKSRAKIFLQNKPAEKNDFVEIEYQSIDIDSGKKVKDKFILGEGGFVKDFEYNIIGMKAGEEREFKVIFPENSPRKDLAGKDVVFKAKMISVQKIELPEINDEFAKAIGAFDGIAALKDSLKESIMLEKKEVEKQKKRGEIIDKISERINFEIPEIMVNYEKNRLLEDLKQKISQNIKIAFEDYLASIKQTEENLKETFSKEAEKRIKNFLVLRGIGKKEGIEVSDLEVEKEIEKSIKNYTKEQIGKIDIEQLKEYTKGAIYNEKVFQRLENFGNNS